MGSAENVSYTASVGSFLGSVTKKTGPLRYEIVFGENTGLQRAVTLTFEALDGSSSPFTTSVNAKITITQLAAAPTIAVVTTTNMVGSS